MVLVALVSVGIGLAFALVGLWPVLPLAGLEALAVAAGLYACSHRGLAREVISVQADTVRVERGRRRPERCWSFPRSWLRVTLQGARVPAYPARLVLRSHGRSVEVGRFLTEDERRRLAVDLRDACAGVPLSPRSAEAV
jgi:uncharacterized membrane protein